MRDICAHIDRIIEEDTGGKWKGLGDENIRSYLLHWKALKEECLEERDPSSPINPEAEETQSVPFEEWYCKDVNAGGQTVEDMPANKCEPSSLTFTKVSIHKPTRYKIYTKYIKS